MALPYSWPHSSGQWTPSSSASCCFGPQTKFAMASAWPWVSELSEQEVSKALIGTCPLHLGDAFKLRLSLLGSARAMLQLCLCLTMCLAAPWLAFNLLHHHGLLWRSLVFSWTLLPSSGSLCSVPVGTMSLCPCQWGCCPAGLAVVPSSELASLYWATVSC